MKEDFLYYIWAYQLFNKNDLKTAQSECLAVVKTGLQDKTEGPDFKQAQIIIDNQRWAGHIEIHLKSSDWYAHHHETDPNYDNVILHVVWENDIPVFRKNQTSISTLELKGLVSKPLLDNYQNLIGQNTSPACAKSLKHIDHLVIDYWLERLYLSRLEQKLEDINELLSYTKNHWAYTLFVLLAKYFGLKQNGSAFQQMAKALDYKIMQQERHHALHLEALFFGLCGLLNDDKNSDYQTKLSEHYNYLSHKYNLPKESTTVTFFRLRPPNFPTIRLSQLAELYKSQATLFEQLINADYTHIQDLLKCQTGNFWQTHYVFDKEHHKKSKFTGKAFIDLIIINVIAPLKLAYKKHLGQDNYTDIIDLVTSIKPEQNHIVKRYQDLGLPVNHALQSQAILTLQSDYCTPKRCLDCHIGLKVLSSANR